uniref:E3 ubiquitin protein ligase n=1 Tax=Phallusia mammillata TaxID=59560 RepID=A0A6F9DRM8_9ASCI|nr:E3 ubiquitin-protein ligase BRE1B [Phallusia mammillata]
MATKRQLDSSGTSDQDEPQAKRPSAILPAVTFGPVTSLDELDLKTLQFQNKKLWERIEVRRQAESELLEQIQTMEAKQTATEATLSLVNRYWDQLDENMKVLLQRVGVEKIEQDEASLQDDVESDKMSFLRLLGDKEFQDIKENVTSRLEFSKNSFAKAIDAIMQENDARQLILEAVEKSESVEENVKQTLTHLEESNTSLQQLTTKLQAEHHKFTHDRLKLEAKVEELEDRVEELQETAENARWELKKTRLREDRLTKHLAETLEKLSKGAVIEEKATTSTSATQDKESKPNGSDEHQLIAESRLVELEKMKTALQEALKELEKAKTDLKNIPESLIVQTSEYKTLKSQFSVLYHESVQMKVMLDESRALLQQSRISHTRRIEQMECDELQSQKKLRNELIQLEDTLAKVRHDYEALHAELEQNLAANEQAGPVNREMRHLINSLQNHNRQLKGEIQRYKKKVKELQNDLSKAKQEELRKMQAGIKQEADGSEIKTEPSEDCLTEVKKEAFEGDLKKEASFTSQEVEDLKQKLQNQETKIDDCSVQLKSSQDQVKELKLLLDMYKSLSKEQREKAEIMASEKDARSQFQELEDQCKTLKETVASMEKNGKIVDEELASTKEKLEKTSKLLEQEEIRADRAEQRMPRGPDAETMRKIKVLEETIAELRRNVAATKQEEEALLSEMDVTGQAFEDMQEQNMRLLQQLREKDDANFKLMSERIKANQMQRLLQEEKVVLQDQAMTLHSQVEAQNQVVRRLEEKERALQTSLNTIEKELMLRSQAMDLHKRKAVEMAQVTEDAKKEMEKQKERLNILEESVDRKVESLEEEHFKLSRLQEDGARLRRKLAKHKKTEGLYSADEVLMEEIKEYKTKLRCPCCNVNNKDAVLTKCFHVFCIKCIKTRYETRQRKCPKCNAGFGGNDFHRIYIE